MLRREDETAPFIYEARCICLLTLEFEFELKLKFSQIEFSQILQHAHCARLLPFLFLAH